MILRFLSLMALAGFALSAHAQDTATSIPDGAGSAYLGAAQMCGNRYQDMNNHPPSGATPSCGATVREIVRCFANSAPGMLEPGQACSDADVRCANGPTGDYTSGWVKGENCNLERCGYVSVEPTSDVCYQPGAIRAYMHASRTYNGIDYGHAEFVCGPNQYCSVYDQPLPTPFPQQVADGCWVPKFKAGQARRVNVSIPPNYDTTAYSSSPPPTFDNGSLQEYADQRGITLKDAATQMLMTYANWKLQRMASGDDRVQDDRPTPAKVVATYSAEQYSYLQSFAGGLAPGGAMGAGPGGTGVQSGSGGKRKPASVNANKKTTNQRAAKKGSAP